ncbi:MAG TPA: mechanosensitive ion channel domain-containing protein [Gemmatirosa sp.]
MKAIAVARVGDVLDAIYLGNPLRAWLTAGTIFVVALGVLLLVRGLLIRRLSVVAPRTATELDDVALGAVRRTRALFLVVVAVAIARAGLDLPERYDHRVDVLARLAFYLQLVSWGNGAVAYWLARARANRLEHDKAALTSLNLLGVIARITLWVVLILLGLDALGINVTALITGLGVAGVAVALAVQSTLGDLLASLAIALDKPFVVGDFIVVDQYMGTVESVGLKTTRIRSISGEQIIIANAELLKARIRNYQRQSERRVVFQLAIDPGTATDVVATVPGVVREVVTAIPQTRLDRTHFSAITDAAFVVETVYFVTSADYNLYMDIQQRINLALLDRLRAAKVQLAFSGRETVLVVGSGAGAGVPGTTPAPTTPPPTADAPTAPVPAAPVPAGATSPPLDGAGS